jgi:hypothetical protein
LSFTNQLLETLLAENFLQEQLFDTGIKTLPATLSNFGETPPSNFGKCTLADLKQTSKTHMLTLR